MKKLFFICIASAILFVFSGCDGLNLTKDIEIDEVEIETDDFYMGGTRATRSTDTYSSFEWTQTVNVSDFSNELEGYDPSLFKKVICGSASIRVFSPDGTEGSIIDLLVETSGTPKLTFSLPSYSLGEIHDAVEIKAFAEKFMFQLFTQTLAQDSFTVKITGKTNIPDGERLRATILMKKIRVTVKVID